MLNLEALIARLVEDVIRAIRSATLEELRDLNTASTTASPRKSSTTPRFPGSRPAAQRRLARRAVVDPHPGNASDRTTTSADGAIRWSSLGRRSHHGPGAPPGNDAFDLARANLCCLRRGGGAPTGPEEEPPSGTTQPVVDAASCDCCPGERLASVSGASVVIRRAKGSGPSTSR